MKLTFTDQTGKSEVIEVDPVDTIFSIRPKIGSKFKVTHYSGIKLSFNGKELDPSTNFIQNQIKEGAVINIQTPAPAQPPQGAFGGHQAGGQMAPQQNMMAQQQRAAMMEQLRAEALKLRDHFQKNAFELENLLEKDPEFAQAILSDNIQDTMNMLAFRRQKAQEKKMKAMQEEMRLNSNPFDIEAQREIERRISEERHNKE